MFAPRLKYLSVLQTGAEKCTLQENKHATRVLKLHRINKIQIMHCWWTVTEMSISYNDKRNYIVHIPSL